MIRERDITVAEISSFLGINRSSVYKVMRGEAVFSLDNMKEAVSQGHSTVELARAGLWIWRTPKHEYVVG